MAERRGGGVKREEGRIKRNQPRATKGACVLKMGGAASVVLADEMYVILPYWSVTCPARKAEAEIILSSHPFEERVQLVKGHYGIGGGRV